MNAPQTITLPTNKFGHLERDTPHNNIVINKKTEFIDSFVSIVDKGDNDVVVLSTDEAIQLAKDILLWNKVSFVSRGE